jgi:hypothetical protein
MGFRKARLADLHVTALQASASDPKRALAFLNSITSSARINTDCGTVRPSAAAVFRLITSSNAVGCWTGKLAAFSPLRILPAEMPPWRETAVRT